MSYTILDLENGTQEKYGRISHFLYNDVVAIGTKSSLRVECNVIYLYPNILQDLEIKTDVLVMHNAKYDMLYLWNNEGFRKFLLNGGKIFCTMTAQYFLSGQQEKFPSLRDIAVEQYGCKAREKLMESFWDRGVDTMDIPKELVLEDLRQDVLDTEQVYLGQLQRATPQMLKMLDVQMNLLLSTTEMEYNGMYVKRSILCANKAKLVSELSIKTEQLGNLIKKHYQGYDFNQNSLDDLSRLLFGGILKVKVQEPALNPDGTVYVFKTGQRKGEIKLVNVEKDVIISGLGLKPIGEANKKGIYKTNEGILSELLRGLE